MRISVVIPARDAATTLAETLDSIAAQTARPDEIIVVDDGSTDATAAIAANHWMGPRVLRQPAAGAAAAINAGVAAASGTLLAFIDSDDLWTPQWLASAAAALERSKSDAVLGEVETFIDPAMAAEEAARLRYQAGAKVGFLLGACMMRRDVFVALGGLDARYPTGYFIDFYDRFRIAGYRIETVSGAGLRRRIRAGSLTRRSAVGATLSDHALSRDFLQIARAAILRRRTESGKSE
jgi:glycosyltransferase involved in cell wall biosynthesis